MKRNTVLNSPSECLHGSGASLLQTNSKLFPTVCIPRLQIATKATKAMDMMVTLQPQPIAAQSLKPTTAEMREQKSENHDKNGNKSYQYI
ncbi:hypothetical protein [Polluticoccus soli]|uniref:hypothetical protein n=1 Tax=Polluticoccus soli TaxID=3034150 RepID=UPI0023E29AFC|nr:hypothetical protein [Flavipsychrobacter sp. JY13-12]